MLRFIHQVEIADCLLKFLLTNEGRANTDNYNQHLEDLGYKWVDVSFIRDTLISDGVLEYLGDQQYFIGLTGNGWKAAEAGLSQYELRIEQKHSNDGGDVNIGLGTVISSEDGDITIRAGDGGNVVITERAHVPKDSNALRKGIIVVRC